MLIFSHSSQIFKRIRELDNLSDEKLLQSLDIFKNKEMVFKAGQNSGQSGSFFFFTHDQELIIKTMRYDESFDFLKSLDSYIEHLEKNPNSILSRIYGLFTIKMKNVIPVQIILMQNTIKIKKKQDILHIFDMKGSLYKRKTKKKGRTNTTTLKDIDFLELNNTSNLVSLSPIDIHQLCRNVKLDS